MLFLGFPGWRTSHEKDAKLKKKNDRWCLMGVSWALWTALSWLDFSCPWRMNCVSRPTRRSHYQMISNLMSPSTRLLPYAVVWCWSKEVWIGSCLFATFFVCDVPLWCQRTFLSCLIRVWVVIFITCGQILVTGNVAYIFCDASTVWNISCDLCLMCLLELLLFAQIIRISLIRIQNSSYWNIFDWNSFWTAQSFSTATNIVHAVVIEKINSTALWFNCSSPVLCSHFLQFSFRSFFLIFIVFYR